MSWTNWFNMQLPDDTTKRIWFTQQSVSFKSSGNEKEDIKYYLKKNKKKDKNSTLKDSAMSTKDKTEEQEQASQHIRAFR